MVTYNLADSISILERTPITFKALLNGLPDVWVRATEGENTWSPYDVIGHLIHGERTDWIPRARHILSKNPEPFEPFDRFAQFTESRGKTLSELLDTFEALRMDNIKELKNMNLKNEDYLLSGMHPAFGQVNLGQLLSTWTVHDLSHLAQVSRVMAKVYSDQTGPWRTYLPILKT